MHRIILAVFFLTCITSGAVIAKCDPVCPKEVRLPVINKDYGIVVIGDDAFVEQVNHALFELEYDGWLAYVDTQTIAIRQADLGIYAAGTYRKIAGGYEILIDNTTHVLSDFDIARDIVHEAAHIQQSKVGHPECGPWAEWAADQVESAFVISAGMGAWIRIRDPQNIPSCKE